MIGCSSWRTDFAVLAGLGKEWVPCARVWLWKACAGRIGIIIGYCKTCDVGLSIREDCPVDKVGYSLTDVLPASRVAEVHLAAPEVGSEVELQLEIFFCGYGACYVEPWVGDELSD